ncbi:MAG: hypothetical protein JXA93_06425 [Anaerolineae bacterium]|nr:hypothetical protein [Anaerolineae bacterium]
MTGSPYPPDYIKLPTDIACADVEDNVIVTMARILGICWDNKYRRSRPYTPDELAETVDRPRTTLYRHLNRLQTLGWLRVDHVDRRLVLQPLVRITEGKLSASKAEPQINHRLPEQKTGDNDHLREALQEAGIIGRPFHELFEMGVDPNVVRAWHWWTWAPEQEWMENPAGYIVNRLREGDPPPDEFMRLARLTPDETALLRRAWVDGEQLMGWPMLDECPELQRIAPLWARIYNSMRGHRLQEQRARRGK